MNLKYLRGKPLMLKLIWEQMEAMQDKYPYLEFGWFGFIPMVLLRGDYQ